MKRSSLVVVISLVVGVVASGCSAKKDFENLCNAEQRSGAAGIADPSEKALKISLWLNDNVTGSEAVGVMQALASVSGDDRGNVLRQAAKDGGYDGPCPMADAR